MNRSNIAQCAVLTATTISILAVAVAAFARPPYVAIVKKVYPDATISCNSCHNGKPPAVNKYGKSVKTVLDAAKTKTLTEEMIKKLDKKGVRPDGVPAPKK